MTRSQLRAVAREVAEQLIADGPMEKLPLVGLKEINQMFGTKDNTSYQWKARGLLPKPDVPISGNPLWRVPTIYAWADATNRQVIWDPWSIADRVGDDAKAQESASEEERIE